LVKGVSTEPVVVPLSTGNVDSRSFDLDIVI
jgi:hypothetical protein